MKNSTGFMLWVYILPNYAAQVKEEYCAHLWRYFWSLESILDKCPPHTQSVLCQTEPLNWLINYNYMQVEKKLVHTKSMNLK